LYSKDNVDAICAAQKRILQITCGKDEGPRRAEEAVDKALDTKSYYIERAPPVSEAVVICTPIVHVTKN
jgi:hypothetical protein